MVLVVSVPLISFRRSKPLYTVSISFDRHVKFGGEGGGGMERHSLERHLPEIIFCRLGCLS